MAEGLEIPGDEYLINYLLIFIRITLISLMNVEVGINVEGVQKLPNH